MSDEKTENVLQVVGTTGVKKAFLNVSREEALRRYHDLSSSNRTFPIDSVQTVRFDEDDMIEVYDAWES